MISDEGAQTEL